MSPKTKLFLNIFAIVALSIAIAFVYKEGLAWTSPTVNPPGGSGVIKASGGNVGIGTATPGQKLSISGGDIQVESGQGRFKGWVNGGATGRAVEVGISGGVGYIYNYDRTLGTHGDLYLGGGTGFYISSAGNVGVGTISPDSNYKITTTGGGIKAENSSAQPAGYFNNAGGGPAITAGTGGITLGGVNKTSWPGTTYVAGTGISISGTTITNTGDTNSSDDITSITAGTGISVTGSGSSRTISASSSGPRYTSAATTLGAGSIITFTHNLGYIPICDWTATVGGNFIIIPTSITTTTYRLQGYSSSGSVYNRIVTVRCW